MRGKGPEDFTELVLGACAHLLALSDLEVDELEGGGWPKRQSPTAPPPVSGTGGSRLRAEIPTRAPCPSRRWCVRWLRHRPGYVGRLGAIAVGVAALHLGAGRASKEDEIDHAVGIVCHRRRGDAVEKGDVLAEVHARDDSSAAVGVERGARGVRDRRCASRRAPARARRRGLRRRVRPKGRRTSARLDAAARPRLGRRSRACAGPMPEGPEVEDVSRTARATMA